MNLFPFTLGDHEGYQLFHRYLSKHLPAILAERGGGWYWTDVQAIITSPTSLTFTTYGDREVTLERAVVVKAEMIADVIETRKRLLAEREVHRRRELAAKAALEAEIDAVYKELFP